MRNREIIFCWGYHGFADWYISTTDRNAGIPQAVKDLSKLFEYNDIDGLKESLRESRELGFDGKGCIHPRQIKPIHDEFAPSESEIELSAVPLFLHCPVQSE